jgi:hypothetical protein
LRNFHHHTDGVETLRCAGKAIDTHPITLSAFCRLIKAGGGWAKQELLEEMVAYRKDATGIDREKAPHAPRIKLAIEAPDSNLPLPRRRRLQVRRFLNSIATCRSIIATDRW